MTCASAKAAWKVGKWESGRVGRTTSRGSEDLCGDCGKVRKRKGGKVGDRGEQLTFSPAHFPNFARSNALTLRRSDTPYTRTHPRSHTCSAS